MCDFQFNNQSGNKPTNKQTNKQIYGRDFPGQTRRSAVGWDRCFPSPSFSALMGSCPGRLLQAFCRQLEFLHCTGFVEAFWASSFWQANSMTFSPPLGCQAEATRTSQAPSTVLRQSNPRAPAWAAAMLANLAAFPPAFIQSRCLAGPLGDVHATACMVESNPFLWGGRSLWTCKKASGCLCRSLAAVLRTRLSRPLPTLT